MAEPNVIERQVIGTIWSRIELLLCHEPAEASIRCLMSLLPDPSTLSYQDLPELAKLHVSSARNLMTTMKLLVPDAFTEHSTYPDMSVLDSKGGCVLDMMAVLIDLQMFHLQRASTLTAHSRQRLCQLRHAAANRDTGSDDGSGTDGYVGDSNEQEQTDYGCLPTEGAQASCAFTI